MPRIARSLLTRYPNIAVVKSAAQFSNLELITSAAASNISTCSHMHVQARKFVPLCSGSKGQLSSQILCRRASAAAAASRPGRDRRQRICIIAAAKCEVRAHCCVAHLPVMSFIFRVLDLGTSNASCLRLQPERVQRLPEQKECVECHRVYKLRHFRALKSQPDGRWIRCIGCDAVQRLSNKPAKG